MDMIALPADDASEEDWGKWYAAAKAAKAGVAKTAGYKWWSKDVELPEDEDWDTIGLPADDASEEDYYTWLKDSGLADDEDMDMMVALAPNDASEEDWGCGYWCKKAKAKVAAAKAKKAAAKKAKAAAVLAKVKKSPWAAA